MRSKLLVTLALVTLLSSCTQREVTDGSGSPGATGLGGVVGQIFDQVKKICDFPVAEATITGILALKVPELQAVGAVANAICNAVESQPTGPDGAMLGTPNVRGVEVLRAPGQ